MADRPTVIVVVGAAGAPEFGTEFAAWADRWAAAAGRGQAAVVQIGRDPLPDAESDADRRQLRAVLEAEVGSAPDTRPATAAATQSAATRPAAPVATAAATTAPAAATSPAVAATASTRPAAGTGPVWLVLIGHGTYDGREAKFNLRGPDVSARELAEWLKPCRRPLAVIDCASASAPFLNALSAPGRVVVTATRSGSEAQFARFGASLSAAVGDPAADLDKDGQTSLLEAYLAAAHGTEAFYKEAGRIATEHALLDDTGDALGTPADWFRNVRATKAAKAGTEPDGRRAHQWHLVPTAAERALPPDVRARRDALELQVQALRDRKATLPEAEYYARLDALLVELARAYGP